MPALCVFGRGIEKVNVQGNLVWRPTRYIETLSEQSWHTGFRTPALMPDDERAVVAGANANAIAAADIYSLLKKDSDSPKLLIFAAGRPGYIAQDPDPTLSEGKILKERFLRITKLDSRTRTVVQDKNKNTKDDLVESIRTACEMNITTMILITITLHMPRTKEFHRRALIENPSLKRCNLVFMSSESILSSRDFRYAKIFSEVQNSRAWEQTRLKEQNGVRALKNGTYQAASQGYAFSKPDNQTG